MIMDFIKRSFAAYRVIVTSMAISSLAFAAIARADEPQSLRQRLKAEPLKIAWEAMSMGIPISS